jgi:hypothetical protein
VTLDEPRTPAALAVNRAAEEKSFQQSPGVAKPLETQTGPEAVAWILQRLTGRLDVEMHIAEGGKAISESQARRAQTRAMAIAEDITYLCGQIVGHETDARELYRASKERVLRKINARR